MKILQYTHYIYLVLAVMFAIRGFEQYQSGENSILSFLFAGLAVFMFFFRRKFSNKINKQDK